MSPFTGTRTLFGVALRRDWLRLSIWIAVITLIVATTASALRTAFPTQEALETTTALYAVNPVFRMFGLASDASVGAFLNTRSYLLFAILVALMSLFAVVRHTRGNEDMGRTELIGSAPVGRHAQLTAALILALGANALLTVLVALVLILNELALAGSLATGAAVGAVGMVFAGIGAVTAQLAGSGRGANGLGVAALGVGALVSSFGNLIGHVDASGVRVEPGWPAWLSPFGWGQLMRPYADDQWGYLLLFLLLFAGLVATAFRLASRRDIGQGLLPQRRGPERAAGGLLSPTGLAWRLQRSAFFGWLLGLVLLGMVYAAASSEVEALVETLEDAREIFAQMGGTDAILDGYFTAILGVIGILVTVYTLQTLGRMRQEELHGPLETVLSTATHRSRWMLAHASNAGLGAIALFVVVALATASISVLVLQETQWMTRIIVAALVQIPATLVLAGLALAAIGWLPRHAPWIVWAAFGVAVLVGPMFAAMLDLPRFLRDLSPFTHTPGAPAEAISMTPLLVMIGVAFVLGAVGFWGMNRRDIGLH